MKKLVLLSTALILLSLLIACGTTEANPTATHVEHSDWSPEAKSAINALVDTYGMYSGNYDTPYAVFDFDNTCSIFDVEEQLAVYQLQVMAFAITPEQLPNVLFTEIGDHYVDRTEHGYGKGSYADWVDDITKAYSYLYATYGPFNAKGLDDATQKKIQADPQWAEFATKMRAMYDLIYDVESASVAYPWILYWFTGMTEQEVYDLAFASHSTYKAVPTSQVTWKSPATIASKVGVVEYTWTSGIQVSENIRELWNVLQSNGIDVWVCSASGTDTIRAAVDAWGLHDYCKGIIAMTNVKKDGKYVNAYDYKSGTAWIAGENGTWSRGSLVTGAQTQGVGKTTAITNAIAPLYKNHGPIAGFMDSTGDYNFCTEFKTLKLVICFNRASRKITDGGGIISAVAVYEADTLGYDFAKADAAGDTLYILQGREELGLRGLRPTRSTMLYGKKTEQLFKNSDNYALLTYITENQMSVGSIIDTFAIKTAKDATGNQLNLDYGFLKTYSGYHSHR